MKKLLICYLMTLGLMSQSFAATDLMDIYHQALENDPVFKNAYDTYMANKEALPQAWSALLPQAGLTAQTTRNFIHVNDGFFTIQDDYYKSRAWQFSASQAVFNYQAWARVQQARSSVKAAQATFNDAAQNLILRTAKAYFDILFAQDTLNFAEAKKRANMRQYEQAKQRFEVGLDPITSVYEAKAAYDQSVATVIASRNNQENQSENLRKLTNHVYESIAPLRNGTIPLVKPEPNDVDEWIDTGLRQNYKLWSAKYNLEVARQNMKALSAGNWPTIAIQGKSTETTNEVNTSSPFLPANQKQSSIGLALNFPAFQGGLVLSQTRQAKHNFQATSEQVEQTYRDVVVNSRIAFNTITDGISKVKADRQTIISQQNSLESTEAQFEVGTRTMVDVVNAQQRLFEAQNQLANDQYNLINAVLTLKYLAGTLNVNDLELINSWLATTRVSRLPPAESKTTK
ncbi:MULTISPECIES: TolC family outer membrane protein [Legionella]|uniref:TolC family outer membrane protein n=1 Tax=Legionella resiliens TaxID=2905958 RepID=A0ABS8X4X4_9GAMM|nr:MULTISPECIES: TolC family outer membrane protein [unclassified Legionella]MCE0723030.1 TolC family outer membrane protein [Legionella sp. 9fVS26]MCE3532183.1 TolC family outer membrane protein [Legionella sp. 8cVS16]QLZ68310.1 membrane protein [Legionella sp. PC1000]